MSMELLTVQETARLLRVNPITVRRYIADGKLQAVRVGRGMRVHKEAIERFAVPVAPHDDAIGSRRPADKTLTYADPLWQLVGSAVDAAATDAARKYEYLAEGLSPRVP